MEPENNALVRYTSRYAVTLARFDEAVTLGHKAVQLDPLYPLGYANLGIAAYFARTLDDAAKQLKKVFELDPEHPMFLHSYLSLV